MKFRARGAAVVIGAVLAASAASAQNVGNNAGIWWNPAPGQPSSFTILNPLTTMYFRIGLQHAFQGNSGYSHTLGNIAPAVFPGQNLSVSDALGVNLGLGFRLLPVLRYELQFGGTFDSTTSANNVGLARFIYFRASSVQLMNNLYLDVAPFFGNGLWGLNPYVLGGVGISWNFTGDQTYLVTVLGPGSDATRTDFAWNVGVGLQWQVMNNLILDVAYRYLDAGRFRNGFSGAANFTTRYDNTSHQIMFGVVVPFDGLIRGFGN